MEIKTFNDLRLKMGAILGMAVPPKSLESIMHKVDTRGGIGNKQLMSMFIAMYNFLEANTDGKIPEKENI